MRHIILAMVIIAIVISLGVFEQVYAHDTLEDMLDMTNKIVDSLYNDDIAKANDVASDLNNYWSDRRNTLELLFNHNEFRELPALIGELVGYIEVGNAKEAIVRASVLISDLNSHMANTRFCISNII